MSSTAALLGAALMLMVLGGDAAVGPYAAQAQAPEEPVQSAAVPFTLDHNRMIVEVELVRPDGTARPARAWVDTGNQYLILAEGLARDLGLDVSLLAGEEHSQEVASPAPPMRLGGLPVRVHGIPIRVHPGPVVRPGVPAEVNLPASALRHDHVVFDYPARRLTLARPGVLEPKGVGVPCQVSAETGLFLISATVDGETMQLGVDNGSAGTWVSTALTTEWRARHPDWPHAIGAAGSANFFGFPFETEGVLMRLPQFELGAVPVRSVALLGLDQSLFDWYSKKSAAPVVGFVGANVLGSFRLEVDFPGQMTYWQRGSSQPPADLEIVGLTLHPEADGSLTVAGIVARDGTPTVEGVQPGDRILRVNELDAAAATMGAVVDALRGTPGATRTLLLERDGETLTVEARVLRLP